MYVKMSYERFTKAQLKELCEQRGINIIGLKYKAEIIDAIKQDDMRSDEATGSDRGTEEENEVINGREESDEEEQSDDESFQSPRVSASANAGVNETDEIVALRLRLQLAREERKAREIEREAREREWEIEQQRMELQTSGQGRGNQPRAMSDIKDIKAILPAFCDSDALAFFTSLERILELNAVDRTLWSKLIPGQLSPRALKIFSRLSLEETKSYDAVKSAILAGFQLNDAAYLRMFRQMRRSGQSTYRMHLTNLREVMLRYFESKGADTFEKVAEVFLFEQFMLSLNENVRQFVQAKQPKTTEEAASYADLSYEIHRIGKETNAPNSFGQSKAGQNGDVRKFTAGQKPFGRFGNRQPEQYTQTAVGNGTPKQWNKGNERWQFKAPNNDQVKSWRNSQQNGFKSKRGTNDSEKGGYFANPNYKSDATFVNETNLRGNNVHDKIIESNCDDDDVECMSNDCVSNVDSKYVFPVIINHDIRISGLRDTGCNGRLILDESIISPNDIKGDEHEVYFGAFDGNKQKVLPVAEVTIASPHFGTRKEFRVKAAIANLPKGLKCILGNQLFSEITCIQDMIQVKQRDKVPNSYIENEIKLSNRNITKTVNNKGEDETDIVRTQQAGGARQTSGHSIADCSDTLSETGNAHSEIRQISSEPRRTEDDGNEMPNLIMTETFRGTADNEQISESTEGGQTLETDYSSNDDQDESNYSDTNEQSTAKTVTVMTRRQAARLKGHNENNNVVTDSANKKADEQTDQTETNKIEPTDEEIRKTLHELAQIDVSDVHETKRRRLMQIDANDFRLQQQTDTTLHSYFVRAKSGSAEFVIQNGLLYKKALPNVNTTNEYLLVVPNKYRNELISLTHDDLYGGHNGVRRTKLRLLSYFWWPKLSKMTAEFIRTCHKCQKNARMRKADRLPLQPIAIHANPFDDISFDIAGGTLPKTARGNRYLLILLCNVSKYIHAIPLRNLKTKTIVDKLLEWWTFVGIPSICRSDNMPAFKSQLLTAITQRFGIEMRYSKPMHFESHGGIERTVQIVENSIKKCMEKNDRNWDIFLPYILFALREMPNASTGYSANQMIFGRNVRSILSVVKDAWENTDLSQKEFKLSTAKYMQQLSKQLKSVMETARENEEKAKQEMKIQYDKASTQRHLKVGDLALILLPTTPGKLQCEFRGPYQVTRVLNNGNYELDLGKRRTILHINSLRRYHVREKTDRDVVNQLMTVEHAGREDLTSGGPTEGAATLTDRPETNNESINAAEDMNSDRDDKQEEVSVVSGGTKAFRIGTQLTDEQRLEIKNLLMEFSDDVFDSRPGKTDLVMHKIELTDNTPCWQPPYKIPDALRHETEKELKGMLEQDIIQYDPDTKYNSPLIVLRKPQGGIRLVNNFILLNRKTVIERYPMTNANQLLSKVAGAHWLSKIDLKQFFLQLVLHPDSRSCTGFYTEFGTFSYKRLPAGLSGSSHSAQRAIDKLLRNAHKFSGALLDDILIFSTTWKEHLKHVREILQRLKEAGLTANIDKCVFASSDMQVLGHRICSGKIMPTDEKIKAIIEWKRPKTKRQLKSFLGTVNFFHDFVDHFASIANPLTKLLEKSQPDKLNWGEMQEQSFERLKSELIKRPILRPPDPNKEYLLYCDGSSTAISSVLMQYDEQIQQNYVIAYGSRKLTKAEQKYPIIEIELMSIIYGLQKYRHLIYLKKVKVFTDHKPLVWANSLIKHSNRLARWMILLSEFEIETTYISGKNQIADGLTRTP